MDNRRQIIANILTQYFEKEGSISIREFTKRFIEIKNEGATFTEDQLNEHIENMRSMLYKWKNKDSFLMNLQILARFLHSRKSLLLFVNTR